jgi:Zn-dependent protease
MIDILFSGNDFASSLVVFLLSMLSIILAITIHEAAHAFTAYKLGDITPKLQGRLTLNPLAHLDPWGTLLIIVARIGWGRPVEFNPNNLRHPKRDSAIIALAGPASNLLLGFLVTILTNFIDSGLVNQMLGYFIQLNVFLAIFNLIPIEPLDGFKVVGGLLPRHLYYQWEDTKQYGFIILIILLLTGAAFKIILPVSEVILSFYRLFVF